jgi:hypothetical protein
MPPHAQLMRQNRSYKAKLSKALYAVVALQQKLKSMTSELSKVRSVLSMSLMGRKRGLAIKDKGKDKVGGKGLGRKGKAKAAKGEEKGR